MMNLMKKMSSIPESQCEERLREVECVYGEQAKAEVPHDSSHDDFTYMYNMIGELTTQMSNMTRAQQQMVSAVDGRSPSPSGRCPPPSGLHEECGTLPDGS